MPYCQAKLVTKDNKCQNYCWHSKYCDLHTRIREENESRIQDWVDSPLPVDPFQSFIEYQTRCLARRGHSGPTTLSAFKININGNLIISDMYDLSLSGIFNPEYESVSLSDPLQGKWNGVLYNPGTYRGERTALLMIKEGESFHPETRWYRRYNKPIYIKRDAIMIFSTAVWGDKEAFAKDLIDYHTRDQKTLNEYSNGVIYPAESNIQYYITILQNENGEIIAFQILPPKRTRLSYYRL